jgi:hypothetical protein
MTYNAKGGYGMRLKLLLGYALLFIGVFAFSVGLHIGAVASGGPECNEGALSPGDCCIAGNRLGVWNDPPGPPPGYCDCQGLYIGGGQYTNPCDCQLYCGGGIP